MITLWHDLRFALRMMKKTPGVTLVAVLALALGIGVNTSVFCVLSNVLWRPLPVPHADELIWLRGGTDEKRLSGALSYADYADLRDQTQVFSGLLAIRFKDLVLSTGENRPGASEDRGETIWGEFVSGNYFDVLGIRPAIGRTFLPEEDRAPGAAPVVVLSHSLWQRRFHADPQIVGKTVHLSNTLFTIVGVAPKAFKGVVGVSNDYWVPMMMWTPLSEETDHWMQDRSRRDLPVIGRLRTGVD